MKKIFCFIFLFYFSLNTEAQVQRIRISDSGNVWKLFTQCGDVPLEKYNIDFKYFGDWPMPQGVLKTFWFDQQFPQNEFFMLLDDTVSDKTYIYYTYPDDTLLLYFDYNVNVGDSIVVPTREIGPPPLQYQTYWITQKDTITMGPYTQRVFRCKNNDHQFYMIEGIGAISTSNSPYQFNFPYPYFKFHKFYCRCKLMCFYHNGIKYPF